LLDPVQFRAAADSKVSTSDQQVLTEYFYNSLKTNIPREVSRWWISLGRSHRLQVALMSATTAVPGLRTISVVVPQARVLNLAQSMATDRGDAQNAMDCWAQQIPQRLHQMRTGAGTGQNLGATRQSSMPTLHVSSTNSCDCPTVNLESIARRTIQSTRNVGRPDALVDVVSADFALPTRLRRNSDGRSFEIVRQMRRLVWFNPIPSG
jgi:hypothetical protein